MNQLRTLQLCLSCTILVGICGCAAAYHDYPCGNVHYGYCAPPPLPYAGFEACPTPLAAGYLNNKHSNRVGTPEKPLAPPPIPEVVTE